MYNNKYPSKKDVIFLCNDRCIIIDSVSKYIKKNIIFKNCVGPRAEVLKINTDGSLEIVVRGGGFGDVGLADTYGKFIWSYRQKNGGSPMMATGDIDRDGTLEFYIADIDGVHKVDYSGKEIWSTNDEVWEEDIQIYDPGSSKRPLIITRGSKGKIRFRDSTKKLIEEVSLRRRMYGLELVQWPDDYHILLENSPYIFVIDFNGKIILQYKLERDFYIKDVRGIHVKLDFQQAPYLAVIANSSSSVNRAMLSVFSPERQLVYQEVLYSTTGLNKIGNADGSESLLVGDGGEHVWLYTLNKEKYN
jgi:hypothetical protein